MSDLKRKTDANRRQVAAVPVRRGADGDVQILLVTSRGTRRWLIPKGWPWRNCADWQSAAEEAREEGGVVGVVDPQALGNYVYRKGRSDGSGVDIIVTVYRLEVIEVLDVWREKAERSRAWFSIEAAAAIVAEPGLKALLLALSPAPARKAAATAEAQALA